MEAWKTMRPDYLLRLNNSRELETDPVGGRVNGGKNKAKRELKNLEWLVSDGRRKSRGRSWPRGHKEDNSTGLYIDIVPNED